MTVLFSLISAITLLKTYSTITMWNRMQKTPITRWVKLNFVCYCKYKLHFNMVIIRAITLESFAQKMVICDTNQHKTHIVVNNIN